MRKILMLILLLAAVTFRVSAAEMEFSAPPVPQSGADIMAEPTEAFLPGILSILKNALPYVYPAFSEAAGICLKALAVVMIISIIDNVFISNQSLVRITGVVSISILLLSASRSMIPLGADTIRELSSYGKLLLPVMTAALAAQGNVTTSGALYAGTAFFDALLSSGIHRILLPGLYFFLALAIASQAVQDKMILKLKDCIKSTITWTLKIVLYVFTGYMTISGAVSGTTDATAMKAAKVTISSAVPVIGGILADASEAVLVSASVLKNSAGIYGLFAVLAIMIRPFIRIGMQYLLMKFTAAICCAIGPKALSDLISDFSSAMGLLLAMTAAVSIMVLISTVCFMRTAI